MLIERLFFAGIMKMGPSRVDGWRKLRMAHDLDPERIGPILIHQRGTQRKEDGSWAYIDQWRF